MLLEPDPATFVINLQNASKNPIFKKILWLLRFEFPFKSFLKDKKWKGITK
jgi:hypothetical protein